MFKDDTSDSEAEDGCSVPQRVSSDLRLKRAQRSIPERLHLADDDWSPWWAKEENSAERASLRYRNSLQSQLRPKPATNDEADAFSFDHSRRPKRVVCVRDAVGLVRTIVQVSNRMDREQRLCCVLRLLPEG